VRYDIAIYREEGRRDEREDINPWVSDIEGEAGKGSVRWVIVECRVRRASNLENLLGREVFIAAFALKVEIEFICLVSCFVNW